MTNDDESSTLPEADDGFRQPSDETRRRNLTTAAIIVVFLLFWILYGLRKPLFGG